MAMADDPMELAALMRDSAMEHVARAIEALVAENERLIESRVLAMAEACKRGREAGIREAAAKIEDVDPQLAEAILALIDKPHE